MKSLEKTTSGEEEALTEITIRPLGEAVQLVDMGRRTSLSTKQKRWAGS